MAILSLLLLISIPRACDILHGNGPIDLYGQVVDQNEQPAAGVTLNFAAAAWNRYRIPIPIPLKDDMTSWHLHATTGPDGKFELHDGWGWSLSLESISGGTYSQGCRFLGFGFGRGHTVENRTGPDHRATFLCWNDAFKRILQKDVPTHLRMGERHDLTYRDGTVAPMGDGDENLHFRVDGPSMPTKPPYDWEVRLDTDRLGPGGIVPCDGPLGSEAPENGYQEQLLVRIGAGDPNWSNQITRRFYTESGHRTTYAGVEATVALDPDAHGATVTFKYSANFGNSRDLVPGPIAPPDTPKPYRKE